MATQIRHILVAIGDVRRTPRSELRKAGSLARAARARVELFHAIDEPDPERSFPETATFQEVETLRAAIAQKYERRLERFAREPSLRGVTVRCTASWDYPPHDAVIRRALAARIAAQDPRHDGDSRGRATTIPVSCGLPSYCCCRTAQLSTKRRNR
jgi:hypothetical protein